MATDDLHPPYRFGGGPVGDKFIKNLSASKITTGVLLAGETVSSSDFVAGTSGWQITGDGDAEFNNVTIRGTLESDNYDGTDVATGDSTQGWRIEDTGKAEFHDVIVRGEILASTIDIGGSDATSFHVDINGRLWLGAGTFGSAPFRVTNAGALTATNATISGTITGSTISGNTIKTADANDRIQLTSTNPTRMQFFFGGVEEGTISLGGASGADLQLSAASGRTLRLTGGAVLLETDPVNFILTSARLVSLETESLTDNVKFGMNVSGSGAIKFLANSAVVQIRHGDDSAYGDLRLDSFEHGRSGGATASLGFFGIGAGATKQTVTGSRGGNAALASFLTALANYGFIVDSTTA